MLIYSYTINFYGYIALKIEFYNNLYCLYINRPSNHNGVCCVFEQRV